MKPEYVYCAVNKYGEIQWVYGSSRKTRYFKTARYLSHAIRCHNEESKKDPWLMVRFKLTNPVEEPLD